MEKKASLTSVHVLNSIYEKFKVTSVEGSMNFQKLVNRSLDLYIRDEEFRNKINNHINLATTGSKY
jgi:hypothetical protein